MPSSARAPKSASETSSGQRRWEFGRVTFDDASLELRVNNRLVSIQRKPLKVLMHLLHHAGEVVTKDELIAAAWPGRIVSETVLAKAVGKLRDALSDEAQELIKTVHGYGYRFAARVGVVQKAGTASAHFSFKPGDHPPGRPLWSLLQRLGTGGQGEAWLALHDKTRQQRVFKFAIDQTTLAALKREITLFRFLNDSLGAQARVVTLRDWNLEQTPYFLEADYVAGGNLTEWAERSGGLAAIPLGTRLDIAAQIAEAVAAVHSVGVLHKDLKPANVLIDTAAGGIPHALLGDFGSGGMLDARRLESLGITRMGFTKSTSALFEGSAGTPMYLAPELLAGQPPTVKGDVYALGVMLYQLVVGEFRRAMSAGWERNVDDELLRECIADAVQGDAAHRLGDAASLAERLRNLDREREKRRVDIEAKRRAEELEKALALAKSSQAAADFLSTDMFSVVGERPLRDLTVLELLRAAAEKLSDRFGDMPLAAAQVRAALGNAFWRMECMEEARDQFERALAHFNSMGTAGSERALPVAGQLLTIESILDRTVALERYDQVLEEGYKALGPQHPSVLTLCQHIAWTRFARGEWPRAAVDLERVVSDATSSSVDTVLDTAPIQLGRVLISLGEYSKALTILQGARTHLTKRYGATHLTVAQTQAVLGLVFTRLHRFVEAETELSQAERCLEEWTARDAAAQLESIRYARAQLRLAQGNPTEAVEMLTHVLGVLEPLAWMRQSGLIGEIKTWLAAAFLAAGALDQAELAGQSAAVASESACGARHPQTQAARIGLAEIMFKRGASKKAQVILSTVDRAALAELGSKHPLLVDYTRVEGLLSAPVREGLSRVGGT